MSKRRKLTRREFLQASAMVAAGTVSAAGPTPTLAEETPAPTATKNDKGERATCCCSSKPGCAHHKLERDPSECTPEQIRECHGEVSEHPC